MEGPDQVCLGNICGGAVEEIFQRELKVVLENIADPNTDAEGKRKIIFEFAISPFEDRSGAQVEFACTSKLVPTDKVKGTMFLAHRGTSIIAVPHDPKQSRLFEGVDGKSLAAGERDPKKKSDVM
jgi:hypothetical protein